MAAGTQAKLPHGESSRRELPSPRLPEGGPRASGATGLAHVASLAFLATRAAPPLGFPLSVAGGTALARAGWSSLRQGYGAGIAAVIETVAMVGPNKLGGPLSAAITAPIVGRLAARGSPLAVQVVACALLRFAYTLATTTFFIVLVAGGLGGYTDAYDRLAEPLPVVPEGAAASIWVTAVALLAWASFAALIQVLVCARALPGWPLQVARCGGPVPGAGSTVTKPFDPRAVALAATVAFVLLLAARSWEGLAISAGWLLAAWSISRPDRYPLASGLPLAGLLGALAIGLGLLGGKEIGESLQQGLRAILLVLCATWLRAATGELGFREVAQRALWKVRWIPAAAEAGTVLSELGTDRRIGVAVRALLAATAGTRRTPLGVIDSVLSWLAVEAARFRPPLELPRLPLVASVADLLLVLSALVPALALLP